MKRLQVRWQTEPGSAEAVGELAEDRGQFYFEFSEDFQARALPISPFKLPVAPGVQTFRRLPGVFDDALPDGWGRLLMDRFIRQRGESPAAFGALDRLAWMGEHAMGVLTFHPPSQQLDKSAKGFELSRLASEAREVFEGEATVVLPELLQAGGSPGGARPKVLVGVRGNMLFTGTEPYPADYEPWLIKFFAKSDSADTGAVEEAYSRMAQSAGIDFPEHRLFETSEGLFFGVKRFDREGRRRIHMHSLGNMIGADFRLPSLDYEDIHKAVRVLTASQIEVRKLYRLTVFNVMAHNRDDHAKNFAFLFTPETGWRLAPGFDLTYTEGPGGEHTTSICGEGRAPGAEHLRSLAEGAGLRSKEAAQIEEEVREAVSQWPVFAQACGVRKSTEARIAREMQFVGHPRSIKRQ